MLFLFSIHSFRNYQTLRLFLRWQFNYTEKNIHAPVESDDERLKMKIKYMKNLHLEEEEVCAFGIDFKLI